MFSSIHHALTHDLPFVNQLLLCERRAVEYVLVQYRDQRLAFERRGSMLAGALDRVGLFPALAAFVVVASTLWQTNLPWVRELVFLVPAFYFINLMGYGLTQEMDRTIALLECSLAMHDRDTTGCG